LAATIVFDKVTVALPPSDGREKMPPKPML
jgi:hypothetical protein